MHARRLSIAIPIAAALLGNQLRQRTGAWDERLLRLKTMLEQESQE